MVMIIFCHYTSALLDLCSIHREYLPVNLSLDTSFIHHPCSMDRSIVIHQQWIYQYDRIEYQWKQLCIQSTLVNDRVRSSTCQRKKQQMQ